MHIGLMKYLVNKLWYSIFNTRKIDAVKRPQHVCSPLKGKWRGYNALG